MTATQRLLPAFAAILTVAFPHPGLAHRVDEYLQATRIAIELNRVVADVSLTPGAEVADTVFNAIDLDGSGDISSHEASAYAESVVKAFSLDLDGRPYSLTLEKYTIPSLADMRRGEGVIRLLASVSTPGVSPGAHRLSFSNTHMRDIAVYLVNPLLPEDSRIRITGLSRDMLQRQFEMDYTVSDQDNIELAAVWPALLGVMLAGALHLVVWRLNRRIGDGEQIRV